MIQIQTIKHSWSSSDFWHWTESYRQNFPKAERVLIALPDPLHQLAALYAGLLEGRTVLSASHHLTDRSHLHELFKPEAEITSLQQSKSDGPFRELNPNKGLLGIATSGSSGRPKIVLHRPSSLLASADSYNQFFQVTSDDTLSSPLPLHHIGGIMPFWRALKAQAKLVLSHSAWEDVLNFSATHISLVPTQLLQLLERKHLWSNFRCVLIGAQALDPNLFDRAISESVPISVSYGSSESAAVLSATLPGTDPAGSVGVILPNRQVEIIDDKIAFKGEACFHAYQEGNVISHPFNEDGFFLTQDMGRFDEQGKLYILGRADHIFKCGGENVNPTQLEAKVRDKLTPTELMILPIPDGHYGQLPSAFIKPFTPEIILAVKNYNRELPPHQRLRYLNGSFPQSSGIKVSRSYAGEKMKFLFSQWNLMRFSPRKKSKPDLIFLHGFMGSHQSMEELAQHFAADFNIWGIDLPFHGQNQGESIASWNDVIDGLAAILLRFTNPWIYGYSMGGRVALGLAKRHPKLIGRLILEGVHPGLDPNEQQERELHERDVANKMTSDFSLFLQNWYQAPLFALSNEEISKLQHSTAATPELYAKALEVYGLSKQPNLRQCLKSNNPIVLVGTNDQKFCALHPRALAVQNCGHKASYQAPKLVHTMVMEEIARRNWQL